MTKLNIIDIYPVLNWSFSSFVFQKPMAWHDAPELKSWWVPTPPGGNLGIWCRYALSVCTCPACLATLYSILIRTWISPLCPWMEYLKGSLRY